MSAGPFSDVRLTRFFNYKVPRGYCCSTCNLCIKNTLIKYLSLSVSSDYRNKTSADVSKTVISTTIRI